jgi:hypothetical protein
MTAGTGAVGMAPLVVKWTTTVIGMAPVVMNSPMVVVIMELEVVRETTTEKATKRP